MSRKLAGLLQQAWLLVAAALPSTSACWPGPCTPVVAELAVCDAPDPAPRYEGILYDPTSVLASEARLDTTVTRIAEALVLLPGSVLIVGILDSTMSRTREIARFRFAKLPVGANPRAQARKAVASLKAQYHDSLELVLRTTHLLEGLNKMFRALLSEVGDQDIAVQVTALTDAMEQGTGYGSLECDPIPSSRVFVDRVLRDKILIFDAPHRLHLAYAYVDLAGIGGDRCPMTATRAKQVEALMADLFDALGIEFHVYAGPPEVGRRPVDGLPAEVEGRKVAP